MLWDAPWAFQISAADQAIFFEDSEPQLQISRRDLATGSLNSIFHSEQWLS
jgi:hypothetical protein